MSELTNKRIFEHAGYTYTISTFWQSDTPLTYRLHVDRSHGDPIQFEHVADVTYPFEESRHGQAFGESDLVIKMLHDFLEGTIKRGEQPPAVLPDNWMTRR